MAPTLGAPHPLIDDEGAVKGGEGDAVERGGDLQVADVLGGPPGA